MEFNSSYFSFIILYTNMVLPPSGKEIIMNKQKHLNLEARILIETLLNEHHSFKSMPENSAKTALRFQKKLKLISVLRKQGL